MMDVEDQTEIGNMDIQREYVEFLDDASDEGVYTDKVKEMILKNSTRLVVNINDLRQRNPDRCAQLLKNVCVELPLFQKALREVVSTINSDYGKENDEFFVGFEGSFGNKHVTPRTLTSDHLSSLVCVEGIVTKCSLIRPKVVRSVHYCPTTKKSLVRRYGDITNFDTLPSANIYPTTDEDGNPLETEYGHCKYRDNQSITIQEMPEKAPTGQLPRHIDVILDNDLVDTCKPGDRVLVIGAFRSLPGKQAGFTSGVFRSVLLANQITLMSKDASLSLSLEDVKECQRFSKTSNPFEVLARSLAPTIHGHEYIKKALLCLLLGGVEKILPNGTRLRGDVNVLLIGDPSVAKSQMLRYVSHLSPRVVMTTGRGSSGVGLTAAVTTDMETGERRLEAGAMVLADRGIVCIDEFDKMSDLDRTAIHEVMEQGRVTVAKGGVNARLNARTAVLAAANPIYGRYDDCKTPMQNINLQDSLLSRFDLLFIVLDSAEPELDRAISEHVLRVHRYRNPAEQDGEATPLFQRDQTLTTQTQGFDSEKEKTSTKKSIYEKHNDLLHGPGGKRRRDKILSIDFMKKYIHIAKCVKPKLTAEASEVIAEEYSRLRSDDFESNVARTQPVTARTLETMIRLATAHARARMSTYIKKEDALIAIELVQYAYFHKVSERVKRRKRKQNEGEEMDVDESASPEGQEEDKENSVETRQSKKARTAEPDSETTEPMDTEKEVFISDDRYPLFKNKLSEVFGLERQESLTRDKVTEWMTINQGFAETEVEAGLTRLVDDGNIVIDQGIVFLI